MEFAQSQEPEGGSDAQRNTNHLYAFPEEYGAEECGMYNKICMITDHTLCNFV